jgi:CRISPR-associated protein Csd2
VPATAPIGNRYDFVYLFDVTDGNPNGDPDAGNQPRTDPETGEGLVTDVCLKRKIRNAIPLVAGDRPGFGIYFQTQDAPNERRVLNRLHQEAHDRVAPQPAAGTETPVAAVAEAKPEKGRGKKDKGPDKAADTAALARRWMCDTYYDVRAFGAVMTTGVNCGQVRGPVQLTFARSIGRVLALEHAITRKSVTTEDKAAQQIKEHGTITGEMGRKTTVPYGLYRAHGFVSPQLAADTGFTDADLTLLWQSLIRMFEFDHSATRGQMTARGLFVFKHATKLGNAASHRLFERITVEPVRAVGDASRPARSFADFTVAANRQQMPPGVELIEYDCGTFADEPVVVSDANGG